MMATGPRTSRAATSRAISPSPTRSPTTSEPAACSGDRLPPQRKLASRLDIDFTTVARGYVEAQKRGLIESRVGQGTFVRARPDGGTARRAPPDIVDLSMNLPPEPDDPELIDRMQDGVEAFGATSFRCCATRVSAASPADKDAASHGSAAARSCRRRTASSSRRAPIPRFSASRPSSPRPETCSAKRSPIPAHARSRPSLACPCRPADGWRRHRPRRVCRRLRAARAEALYLNPTLLNPTTLTIAGTPARRDHRDCAAIRLADRRG